jgi:hypothetical protein
MTDDGWSAPEDGVEVIEEYGEVVARTQMSGTDHEFRFTAHEPPEDDREMLYGEDHDRSFPEAWPDRMVQGGETYRIGVEDVPEAVREALAEEGYTVTEE